MLNERQQATLARVSPDKRFTFHAFDPQALVVQDEILATLTALLPHAQIFKIGSLQLEIGGQNDIDLTVVAVDREASQAVLMEFFGPYTYHAFGVTNWKFQYRDFPIDIHLKSEIPTEFIATHQRIAESEERRAQYLALKQGADGLPFKEYLARKYAFYNEVMGIQNA